MNEILKSYDPPPGGWESLQARISKLDSLQRKHWGLTRRQSYLAAAAAILLVASLFIGPKERQPSFADLVEKNDSVIMVQLGWKDLSTRKK